MGGWSRAQVSQYAMLNKLCKEAWEIVATSFKSIVAEDEDSAVAEVATNVAIAQRNSCPAETCTSTTTTVKVTSVALTT